MKLSCGIFIYIVANFVLSDIRRIKQKMLNSAKNWLAYIYLQYQFSTCVYMFEPWERKVINTVVIAMIALITFSSYMYLPGYTESLLNLLSSAPNQIDSHLQQPQIIPIIS